MHIHVQSFVMYFEFELTMLSIFYQARNLKQYHYFTAHEIRHHIYSSSVANRDNKCPRNNVDPHLRLVCQSLDELTQDLSTARKIDVVEYKEEKRKSKAVFEDTTRATSQGYIYYDNFAKLLTFG